MKKIILILTASCGLAAAQTNDPTNAPAPAPVPIAKETNAPMTIDSAGAEFDLTAHQALYHGNVRVERPDMKLTCEWLQVTLPEAGGGHLSHVQAETNVVIDFTDEKGQKYHVTSAKAVYAWKVENAVTNETVTFTGSPKVETGQSTIESEPMVWDRLRNKFIFTEPKMKSIVTPGSGTNGAPAKLF
jgi:lipopolysaccharide transport protein LptA